MRIGFVSSEGGPYLIADAVNARNWRGIDGHDYDDLCSWMDARAFEILRKFRLPALELITWEPGVGGVDVLLADDEVVLIHPSGARFELSAAIEPASLEAEVESGVLAILWAPESGDCIRDQDLKIQEARPPSGLLSIDGSSLLVPVIPGTYRCSVMFNRADGQDVRGLILRRN